MARAKKKPTPRKPKGSLVGVIATASPPPPKKRKTRKRVKK